MAETLVYQTGVYTPSVPLQNSPMALRTSVLHDLDVMAMTKLQT